MLHINEIEIGFDRENSVKSLKCLQTMRVAVLINSYTTPAITQEALAEFYRLWIEASIKAYAEFYPEREHPKLEEFTSYDVCDKQEYPKDLDNIDWILMTGGTDAPYANLPWIHKMIEFIQSTVESHPKLKITAVCWGFMILTRALGGKIGENPKGIEIGIKDVYLSPKGQEIFERKQMRLHELHFCIATETPPGFIPLGHSDMAPIQGMLKPGHILALQGHPEWTKKLVDIYLDEKPGHFGDVGEITDDHDGIDIGVHILRFILGEVGN